MEEKRKVISGYAIVFGSKSKIYRDRNTPCWEVIEPGAISQNLLNQMDIRCLFEGNSNKLLSRSRKGVGSLKLSIDRIGLRFEFDVPNTEVGVSTYELVKRGDITGMNAKYTAKYNTKKDDVYEIRHINKIDRLFSISITSNPTFTKTSVRVQNYSDSIGALRQLI